jgi:hydrogenase/urease accessory protein HupE
MLIALGALVAIGWNQALSRQFVAGCACLVGLVHGVLNGAALAEIHSGSLASVGIGMAVWILVALIAGQVAALKQPPARLVVRVAGSWIGAIGLLMLGWAVR